MPAALADLRSVITTARQQGTADQQAEDLLDQAADLANALEAGRKDNRGHNKDEGKGKDRKRPRSWRSSRARWTS